MANTLYDYGRELFLSAKINWATDPIKCCLVDTGAGKYTFSAAHTMFSNVNQNGAVSPAGSRPLVNTTGTGPNLPIVGGAADADDVTFTAVTGSSLEAIVIYKDTGVESTSPLIAYIDTATGLPITPNGGDIIVTWDNGVNKIFRL